ncbi:MAG: YggT family protein [Campylobacterota bacterium]
MVMALIDTILMVITLYTWVVIISALITWVNPDPYNPIVQVLRRLTEPVFDGVRRFIPTNVGGIDLAPMIVIIALIFLKNLLFNLSRGM